MKKKTSGSNVESRVVLFLPVVPAIPLGIVADKFIFHCEQFYCSLILAVLTIYIVPAVAWIRDLVPEWRFRSAIQKELNVVFAVMTVGRGLAQRRVVTIR